MKKNLCLTTALALFLGLALVPIAQADHGKKCCKPKLFKKFAKKAKFFKSNAKEIGLSKDQISSIKKIKLATKKDYIKMKADIKIIKLDIKSELYNHKINVAKVNGLMDKKYDLKKKKAKRIVQGMADLKAVLSAKQYDKAVDIWMEKEKSKCSKCEHASKCSYHKKGR